jgi:hypothetical protein
VARRAQRRFLPLFFLLRVLAIPLVFLQLTLRVKGLTTGTAILLFGHDSILSKRDFSRAGFAL